MQCAQRADATGITMAKRKTDDEQGEEQAQDAPLKPWQERDYTGPLTADQAAWRHAHIKPVQDVETK